MVRIGALDLERDCVCDECGANIIQVLEGCANLYSRDGKLLILCDVCDVTLEMKNSGR